MRMRKPKTSDKTTAELLKEAAAKLFTKYGYEGTTVRQIAKLAGVTAGQITANFGSKENLFNEIVMDICRLTGEKYDPIVGQYMYLKQAGIFTEELAWELIERIVDIQIEFSLDTNNVSIVQLMNVHMFNDEIKTSAMLAQTTVNKIEDSLARLLQEVFVNKRYLHVRTVSRAINGAIVSFGEHPDLLYSEVLQGTHMPDSKRWMTEYIKAFIMNSLHCEATMEATDA